MGEATSQADAVEVQLSAGMIRESSHELILLRGMVFLPNSFGDGSRMSLDPWELLCWVCESVMLATGGQLFPENTFYC